MMRKRRNKLIIAGLLLPVFAGAQLFHHTASLDAVNKDGFYSIPITPALSSYLKTDLSDIRIADENGQWVPHITGPSVNPIVETAYYKTDFIKKENSKTATIIIVRNEDRKDVFQLTLGLKNTAASRVAVVSGSDDQVTWFTITDSILLSAPVATGGTGPMLRIGVPVVNYAYFRITLFNGNKDPLNILEAGYEARRGAGPGEAFTTNPAESFTQRDTTGFSLILVKNSQAFQISKLNIAVASPAFFDRRAKLFTNVPRSDFHFLSGAYPVKEYILNTGNTGGYETPWMKDTMLYVLIYNNDNPPLHIRNITTQQAGRRLVTYLEKGKNYKLLFDNSMAVTPDYDLQKFRDKIPDSLVQLSHGPITAIALGNEKAEPKDHKKLWIWVAIVGVILLLSYFTRSLINDMKKRNKTE